MNFIGEGSIDHGGPTREFFRLLAQEASEKYMRGIDGDKYMASNITALQVHFKKPVYHKTYSQVPLITA